MGLREYKKKRSPKTTPEPFSSSKKTSSLIFVVQKHKASHLHYDLRLEINGVLKSWAIPKGPSLDPQEKRLSILVEDHPYDYHNFEGVIPAGNYGAGTVMVWDTGHYYPMNEHRELANEKAMVQGLKKGKLIFALEGEKLHGLFSLIQFKHAAKGNQWLLIKLKDDFASSKNILKQDRSALTQRTMHQIQQHA